MTPDQIKAIRASTGLSARDFGELIGVDGRTVRYLESGERPARGTVLMILEMIEKDELPQRYFPIPTKRGRKPKPEGE